jgi:acylphosphatase
MLVPVRRSAIRLALRGDVDLRNAIVERARSLGLLGWVRLDDDGLTRVHAEGERVEDLISWLRAVPDVASVEAGKAKVEGHEQFATRGVPAGGFAVLEVAGGFELRLEVDGALRAWSVPKGPSLDPTAKRFAIQLPEGDREQGAVWDEGSYEQGGRVPWPEAIERGHAVFVLHGERLRGGFALQRTGQGRWLLVKRRDAEARPQS